MKEIILSKKLNDLNNIKYIILFFLNFIFFLFIYSDQMNLDNSQVMDCLLVIISIL